MMPVADDVAAAARRGPGFDMTVAHSARIWNYWLGGKDNYAADRQAGDKGPGCCRASWPRPGRIGPF